MDKAKEILYRHTKSANCRSDLIKNPFLEQAVLNAINEALRIHDVVGRSERLILKFETMGKAILPIKNQDITEVGFNYYDFYYKVNETDYVWCVNWSDYLKKKETYMEWYIRVPLSDVSKFLN